MAIYSQAPMNQTNAMGSSFADDNRPAADSTEKKESVVKKKIKDHRINMDATPIILSTVGAALGGSLIAVGAVKIVQHKKMNYGPANPEPKNKARMYKFTVGGLMAGGALVMGTGLLSLAFDGGGGGGYNYMGKGYQMRAGIMPSGNIGIMLGLR